MPVDEKIDAPAGGAEAANIPAPSANPSIEDLFAESIAEAEQGDITPNTEGGEETTPAPDAETTPAEGAEAADAETTPAEGAEAAAPEAESDAVEGEGEPPAPVGEEAITAENAAIHEAQAVTQELLDRMRDPAQLDAILREQGVEKVSELPVVRELLGRVSQSTRDRVVNQLNREQRDVEQSRVILAQGYAARQAYTQKLLAAQKALDDGEPEMALPTSDETVGAFEAYARSREANYHVKTYQNLAETLYALPEMSEAGLREYGLKFSPEQQAALEAVKGQPDPTAWLQTHLDVSRNNLWAMAEVDKQREVAAAISKTQEEMNKAHESALRVVVRKHEAELANIRKTARAQALADLANGDGVPPKSPDIQHTPAQSEGDIPVGASIAEIYAIEKERASRAAKV